MTTQSCVIGKRVTVTGNVSGQEPLIIEGCVEGQIRLGAQLSVKPEAVVRADVESAGVDVDGTVYGNIDSSERISVGTEGLLVGNIKAPRITIAEGARFSGYIDMDVDLPPGIEG